MSNNKNNYDNSNNNNSKEIIKNNNKKYSNNNKSLWQKNRRPNYCYPLRKEIHCAVNYNYAFTAISLETVDPLDTMQNIYTFLRELVI